MTQHKLSSRQMLLQMIRGILMFILIILCAIGVALMVYQPWKANAAYTASLDLGSSGATVAQLQEYLSKDDIVYPTGLVTGYYGPLTEQAVMRFQCYNGIVCSGSADTTGYGRVGPITSAKLNELAFNVDTNDNIAPRMSVFGATSTQNSITVSWVTNEPTKGVVMYGVSYPFLHLTAPRVSTNNSLSTSHSITIPGLASNTNYYYVLKSIDSSGNVTITLANSVRTQ